MLNHEHNRDTDVYTDTDADVTVYKDVDEGEYVVDDC